MSKAVLLSIRPKWCELIASGQKTIEIRKTIPNMATPFRCFIYQAKRHWFCTVLRKMHVLSGSSRFLELAEILEEAHGKVIGEFTCDFIEYLNNLFVGEPDYHMPEYGNPCLKLKDLENYGKGKRLYGWHISDLVIYDKPKELSAFNLKRPPQSWCYVEEQI